jgi:hypothetical protein
MGAWTGCVLSFLFSVLVSLHGAGCFFFCVLGYRGHVLYVQVWADILQIVHYAFITVTGIDWNKYVQFERAIITPLFRYHR